MHRKSKRCRQQTIEQLRKVYFEQLIRIHAEDFEAPTKGEAVGSYTTLPDPGFDMVENQQLRYP